MTHLEPAMLTTIRNLSKNSLAIITKIFAEGVNDHVFIEKHPKAFIGCLVGSFSRALYCGKKASESLAIKGEINASAFDTAFEIFSRGIAR